MRNQDHCVNSGLFFVVLRLFDRQRKRRIPLSLAPAASRPSAETLPQQRNTPDKHKHTQMHAERRGAAPCTAAKRAREGLSPYPCSCTKTCASALRRQSSGGTPRRLAADSSRGQQTRSAAHQAQLHEPTQQPAHAHKSRGLPRYEAAGRRSSGGGRAAGVSPKQTPLNLFASAARGAPLAKAQSRLACDRRRQEGQSRSAREGAGAPLKINSRSEFFRVSGVSVATAAGKWRATCQGVKLSCLRMPQASRGKAAAHARAQARPLK